MANDHIADDRKKVRLIDANAIPKLFERKYEETEQRILAGETYLDSLAEGFTEADDVILAMPTVDAVEVVHGQWVDAYGIRKSKCTSCGVAFGRVMDADCYYCPHCGAKMDGDGNG